MIKKIIRIDNGNEMELYNEYKKNIEGYIDIGWTSDGTKF